MDENEKTKVILDQYKCYNEAKERFIDRNFTTNRFYMVLSLTLLVMTYLLSLLTPATGVILTVCAVGLTVTAMWWLNIDTYQFMIKVKYAKVLERIEEMLPVQPYKNEFTEIQNVKKDKKAIVFVDIQKLFTLFIFCIFTAIFAWNAYLWVRQASMGRF